MKGDKERLIRKPGSFEMTKFLNQKLISQYYPSKNYSGEAKIQLDEHTNGDDKKWGKSDIRACPLIYNKA